MKNELHNHFYQTKTPRPLDLVFYHEVKPGRPWAVIEWLMSAWGRPMNV